MQGIRVPPMEKVAFSGQDVSFNCTACGGSTVFRILDSQDALTLSDSELNARINDLYITTEEVKSQLTFTAAIIPLQNHTVACLVTYGHDLQADQSERVTVPVQGMVNEFQCWDRL